MIPHRDIVIVGAGHGGAQAAIMLRQCGFAGSIALVGDEPELPYERPPLSKDYMAGAKPFERLLLRSPDSWVERGIDLLPGHYVTTVDPVGKSVTFADGGGLSYGTLIWSAGGAPRKLSCLGHDLTGIHAIRTRADVEAIMVSLREISRVVVVGGGYIGLEASAVLTTLGKHVTVIEACDRVLARVAGVPLSHFYEAEHRRHGVIIRTGATVTSLTGAGGRVSGVRLADGETVPADMVIVGIGIVPAVEPLAAAGAAIGDGVLVDQFCRTSLPDIYAIGDCAAHPSIHAGGAVIRLESVQNANDQAILVAKAITGDPQPYRATPWFWSDQFDLKLQTIGLSAGHDSAIVRGKPEERSFSVVYLKNGRVIALDCVNNARDYSHGRRLVELAVAAAPEKLADATAPLKLLLNA